ncbi:hypothetical protein BS1321_26390 [Peribacillus simplex NBRC 15720 = DSM 1321]|uniref:Uncharacterized protein n=1 Tax=Peribacillus simplex NBRC 15720 = DSM 1321 TaxID=1349754 RepID=A0A223EPE3_9BACI|nr:hypothetical protein BS1321_26390 [Peribacillus simplex NBRC 15720 = DSM 1321]
MYKLIFALEQKNSGVIDEANMEAWPNTMKNLMYVYKDAKSLFLAIKLGEISVCFHIHCKF